MDQLSASQQFSEEVPVPVSFALTGLTLGFTAMYADFDAEKYFWCNSLNQTAALTFPANPTPYSEHSEIVTLSFQLVGGRLLGRLFWLFGWLSAALIRKWFTEMKLSPILFPTSPRVRYQLLGNTMIIKLACKRLAANISFFMFNLLQAFNSCV